MKDIHHKFDKIWEYLKNYDIKTKGMCYRITLLKTGKIVCEYKLPTKRLLNRKQALRRRSGRQSASRQSAGRQPARVQTTPDETQFWVCPNCGGDTQMKDGRQYCTSCKIYLSI